MKIENFGLRELTHDTTKDFKVGQFFNMPKLEELPKEFSLGEPVIENQGNTDLCSAYATTSASEFQEGTQLNPYYTFALTKEIEGQYESWGASLKDAMASHVKVGAVKPEATDIKSRNIKDYPSKLKQDAGEYKKETYVSVQQIGMDAFDTIRAFIWKFRDEKRAVIIGVEFGWSLADKVMDEPKQGGGHAMYVYGFRGEYLLVANSYGEGVGEKGTHLFSRKVINQYVDKYGAYAFIDKPREELQYALDNGIKEGDNWIVQLWKVIRALILSPFFSTDDKSKILTTISESLPVSRETVITVEPTPVVHSTAWSGGTIEERKAMYRLASRICDEEGLFPSMKQDFLLTCAGESGFNQWCENHANKNGSFDVGIMQFNSATYLKEYKMTKEEALNNPEKCLRISAKNFKKGRAGNWFAYKAIGETPEQAKKRRERYLPMLKQLSVL